MGCCSSSEASDEKVDAKKIQSTSSTVNNLSNHQKNNNKSNSRPKSVEPTSSVIEELLDEVSQSESKKLKKKVSSKRSNSKNKNSNNSNNTYASTNELYLNKKADSRKAEPKKSHKTYNSSTMTVNDSTLSTNQLNLTLNNSNSKRIKLRRVVFVSLYQLYKQLTEGYDIPSLVLDGCILISNFPKTSILQQKKSSKKEDLLWNEFVEFIKAKDNQLMVIWLNEENEVRNWKTISKQLEQLSNQRDSQNNEYKIILPLKLDKSYWKNIYIYQDELDDINENDNMIILDPENSVFDGPEYSITQTRRLSLSNQKSNTSITKLHKYNNSYSNVFKTVELKDNTSIITDSSDNSNKTHNTRSTNQSLSLSNDNKYASQLSGNNILTLDPKMPTLNEEFEDENIGDNETYIHDNKSKYNISSNQIIDLLYNNNNNNIKYKALMELLYQSNPRSLIPMIRYTHDEYNKE